MNDLTKMAKQHLKPSKYKNVKTQVGELTFDSKKEANRFIMLSALQRAGSVRELNRQVPFTLSVNGITIGDYICDFLYEERISGTDWKQIIEDSKSPATKRDKLYRWKKKHFEAQYGFTIRET